MTLMVIGGDYLGNIPEFLKGVGYDTIKHFSGRKKSPINNSISDNLDLILVLTDYVGTDLSRSVKNKAKKSGIKVAFCRRSWSCIYKELNRVNGLSCEQNCKAEPVTCNKKSCKCGKTKKCCRNACKCK